MPVSISPLEPCTADVSLPVRESFLSEMPTPLEISIGSPTPYYELSASSLHDVISPVRLEAIELFLLRFPMLFSSRTPELWHSFRVFTTRSTERYKEQYQDAQVENQSTTQIVAPNVMASQPVSITSLYLTPMARFELAYLLRKWLVLHTYHPESIPTEFTSIRETISVNTMRTIAYQLTTVIANTVPVSAAEVPACSDSSTPRSQVCDSHFTMYDTPPLQPTVDYTPKNTCTSTGDDRQSRTELYTTFI